MTLTGLNRLFVYGTLVPDGEAWPHLARWVSGEPVEARVHGRLFDTGAGYPGATFGDDDTVVHGVVAALDPDYLTAALAALDRYEGDEYERVVVRTADGIEALAYAWIAPLDGCTPLPDGRWPVP